MVRQRFPFEKKNIINMSDQRRAAIVLLGDVPAEARRGSVAVCCQTDVHTPVCFQGGKKENTNKTLNSPGL